jgi:tetratricopeptide (TPR) repeat protein
MKAFLNEVHTGSQQVNVPADGDRFVTCASKLWRQLRFTQEKMAEDIQAAYLAALASASLWQAIKAYRRARDSAVSALCLSALALRQLLGKHGEHLAGPDHELWTHGRSPSSRDWTPAASAISTLLRQSAGRRVFVLVIGQECGKVFGLPTEQDLSELRKASPEAILVAMEPTPGAASTSEVGNIGKGPFAAIFDWSAFPYPRRAIANGVPPPAFLSAHLRGSAEPDWGARDCIFYFHMRGSLENGTLALTAPERSKTRRELKPAISQFRKKKTGELTVIYIAVNEAELRESNDLLQEIWNERLRGVYIGAGDSKLSPYLAEWKVERIGGAIDDFLAACGDLSLPTTGPTGAAETRHVVVVADMSRDKDGSLIASPGNKLPVTVPDADHEAITRAGDFLYQSDLDALTALKRDPKEYFIGHRVTLEETAQGVPIEREIFATYTEAISSKLADKHPQTLILPSRPSAGASTALRFLAYHFAFHLNIPTLVLTRGGTVAFEAIERLHRVVGRSFLVVADPQDVPSDETRALQTRCAPSRYPVLFLTSVRSTLSGAKFTLPVLSIELSTKEKIDWLQRLGRYCPTVDLGRLMRSNTRSMFFLSLEAFGGSNVRVNPMVEELLEQAATDQSFLLASIAFFSRFTHRHCSDAFLETLVGEPAKSTNEKLEQFDQLLVLRERDGWACRHEDLSKAILQCHLTRRFTDDYRHYLAEFATSIIGKICEDQAGADIAADYVWAMINPQLEAQRTTTGEKLLQSRLLHGDDGVTQDAMRHNIFAAAEKSFPSHVNIVSHFGKFISEIEKKYAEAEHYLMRAHELEEHNEAVMHMLGKRYFDELRELVRSNPPDTRPEEIAQRITGLAKAAHEWFDRARAEARGSEYNFTTAIQLDVDLIRDEFRRLGARTAADRAGALVHESVASLLSHADGLVDEGLSLIEPLKESRQVFKQTRDLLYALRGDLSEAIRCYKRHVLQQKGIPLLSAKVQLARLLRERAEDFWKVGNRKKGLADFEEAQRHLYDALQDPARKAGNIRLWFECARYLPHWHRADLLERLHQLEGHDAAALEPAFLLMCLYFADAVQTGSPESWRKCEEYQTKSAQRSSTLAVRRYPREWLVKMPTSKQPEFRVLPHHLFDEIPAARTEPPKAEGFADNRVRLQGLVSKIDSSTVGYLTIEPTGFRVFFQPRVKDHEFYASDVGRTRVSFLVAFTYEKPQALDVSRF